MSAAKAARRAEIYAINAQKREYNERMFAEFMAKRGMVPAPSPVHVVPLSAPSAAENGNGNTLSDTDSADRGALFNSHFSDPPDQHHGADALVAPLNLLDHRAACSV